MIEKRKILEVKGYNMEKEYKKEEDAKEDVEKMERGQKR